MVVGTVPGPNDLALACIGSAGADVHMILEPVWQLTGLGPFSTGRAAFYGKLRTALLIDRALRDQARTMLPRSGDRALMSVADAHLGLVN
jgi:hypothetical protein